MDTKSITKQKEEKIHNLLNMLLSEYRYGAENDYFYLERAYKFKPIYEKIITLLQGFHKTHTLSVIASRLKIINKNLGSIPPDVIGVPHLVRSINHRQHPYGHLAQGILELNREDHWMYDKLKKNKIIGHSFNLSDIGEESIVPHIKAISSTLEDWETMNSRAEMKEIEYRRRYIRIGSLKELLKLYEALGSKIKFAHLVREIGENFAYIQGAIDRVVRGL